MYFKALSILLLVGAAAGQYNYPKPQTQPPPTRPPPPPPKNTYLPPTPTKKPFQPESQQQVAAEGLGPDEEHEPGMPFDFTYAVKEDDGNDFSHQAQSDGEVVTGEYRTLLPDGRTQIVKYTADWKNGYNAEITYEGEAIYPEPQPTSPRPPPPSRPQTTRAPQTTRPPPPPPRPTTRPPPPPPRPQTTRAPPPPRPTTTRAPPPPRPTTRNPYLSDELNDSQGLRPSPTPSSGYDYKPPPTTRPPPPPTTRRPPPPTTRRPPPPQTTRRPPPPPTTRRPAPPPTTRPPPPPPTTRPPPPPTPPGLYGTPNQPFGVRNHPKFGYSK